MRADPAKLAERTALRACQTWLYDGARRMNDPRAKARLNTTADEFGQTFLQGFRVAQDHDEADR